MSSSRERSGDAPRKGNRSGDAVAGTFENPSTSSLANGTPKSQELQARAALMRTPNRSTSNLPRADLQPSARKAIGVSSRSNAVSGTPTTPRTSNNSQNSSANAGMEMTGTGGGGGGGPSGDSSGTPRTPDTTGGRTPGRVGKKATDGRSPSMSPSGLSSPSSSKNELTALQVDGMIWGTSIDSEVAAEQFGAFVREFKLSMEALANLRARKEEWENDPENNGLNLPYDLEKEREIEIEAAIEAENPHYMTVLSSMLGEASGTGDANVLNVAINAVHIASFMENGRDLYNQLVRYPQEIIPLMDVQIKYLYGEILRANRAGLGEPMDDVDEMTPRVRVRVFNLSLVHRMRSLDPVDIDTLVSIKGMVIRTNSVVPDMTIGYFKCSVCDYGLDVKVQAGRLEDPATCDHCRGVKTMELIHNRCVYNDKQLIKLQETPENIPEGDTPLTLQVFAYEDMVDCVVPGDRVLITGVFRANGIRLSTRARNLRTVFATYIDAIHFMKNDKDRMTAESPDGTTGEYTSKFKLAMDVEKSAEEAKVQRVRAMASAPHLYPRLAHSLAPSIWELEDVKKGVLLQLFSGCNKDMGQLGKTRGEINVLLCGDPGTAKSQLLSYVHRIAPRGMYTSGTGSSAVGLTAYITKDPETKEPVLESGALVLSDRGVCCIDEFDKMNDSTRSILHEVMEQQTVSIAKAGIIATLNARTAVLASANPKESRYNPAESVVENLQLPPTLLSRFDLIYLILDKVDRASDSRLAHHLISLHWKEEERTAANSGAAVEPTSTTPFTRQQVMEYISYAKAHLHPRISRAAGEALVAGYTAMRRAGMSAGRKTIAATPRQLESLVRLSEAHARMRMASEVVEDDVLEAIRLLHVATQQAAIDPRTGTIDMNLIATGHSASESNTVDMVAEAIKEITSSGARTKFGSLGELQKAFERDFPEMPLPSDSDFRIALQMLSDSDDPVLTYTRVRGKEEIRVNRV